MDVAGSVTCSRMAAQCSAKTCGTFPDRREETQLPTACDNCGALGSQHKSETA